MPLQFKLFFKNSEFFIPTFICIPFEEKKIAIDAIKENTSVLPVTKPIENVLICFYSVESVYFVISNHDNDFLKKLHFFI